MAGKTSTKKSTKDTELKESLDINNDVNAETSELDSIKQMMESMMKEIKELKKENISLKKENEKLINNVEESTDDSYDLDYIEISPNQPIKVISLFDGGLTLKVNPDGTGKTFRFDRFGHSRAIAYSDLQDIIAVNRKLIENGYVYICDKNVIKNNYLEEYYEKFLTESQINKILNFSDEEIEKMISSTTRPIQETIITLLVEKINNNEFVNRNKVDIVGRNCSPECDIFSLALQKR